jgi:hypothetical protein
LLKNTHLLRYAHPSSLQRTCVYASFLRISRALYLDVFEQPEESCFFNNLLATFNYWTEDERHEEKRFPYQLLVCCTLFLHSSHPDIAGM